VNLANYIATTQKTVFGTFMTGKNVYAETLPQDAVLILGNEANGISTEVEQLIAQKLAIPRFGSIKKTESLNVASATAIFLSEFKRGFSGM
jgi:TrmH family RNA methyltransferase